MKLVNAIVSFFKGKIPQSVKWEEVREEITEAFDNMKVEFEVTPYYYKVTSGKKTWYWNKDTGEFDGTSWVDSQPPSVSMPNIRV